MNGNATLLDRRKSTPFARLRVEVARGPDCGRVVEAPLDAPLSVGTAEGNDLQLSDPKVSRYHLELMREQGAVRIRDLGSSNGSWIAGIAVEQASITPGTQLSIGDSLLLIRDGTLYSRDSEEDVALAGVVAVSPRAQSMARRIAALGPSNVSVLIQGETGTGKEVAAKALHDSSPRHKRAFIVVDCGSLPATLVSSELFGHERGAFTGADRRRIGAFERASGGTLFLDEIGELPLSVQPTLLGALERRRFRRVGGDTEIAVDVRVLAATHRDLRRSVNDGGFRADLYYRLAIATLHLPALRERPEDIPSLVAHFVTEITGSPESPLFTAEVMASLMQHRWSGNVRELRNVVEAALAVGEVNMDRPSMLPDEAAPPSDGSAPDAYAELLSYREARQLAMDSFERAFCAKLVERCGSNASQAARLAQMDRNHLVSLLKKHGLRP